MKHLTCFICSLSSGGAEHQMTELVKLLQLKGYDIQLVTFADVADHYQISFGIKRVRLASGKGGIMKFMSIMKFFLTVKTDYVISFGQRENLFALLPLLFRNKIKVIAGERNFTIGKPSFIENMLVKFLYKRATYIVPNSYSQAKYIISQNPSYEKKVVTITNYTDINLYNSYSYTTNKVTRIGVFGRYNVQKNCERFVEAINILKKKTTIPFVVEWYGNQFFKDNSINQHYMMMANKVKEYNLEDVLHLNNHIKNVSEVLPSFDCICLPSLFEGFSNSISEAICCGRPMLVSNVSDNSVMVHEGVNGYLFDPLNTDEIANTLLRFLELSAVERSKMALESRKIAEELFDAKHFVGQYEKLINN